MLMVQKVNVVEVCRNNGQTYGLMDLKYVDLSYRMYIVLMYMNGYIGIRCLHLN